MFQPNSIRNETAKLWQLVYSPTAVIALAWVCFQILFYFEPGIDSLIRRSGHVGFAVALGMSLWADSIENRLFRAALRCASLVSPRAGCLYVYGHRAGFLSNDDARPGAHDGRRDGTFGDHFADHRWIPRFRSRYHFGGGGLYRLPIRRRVFQRAVAAPRNRFPVLPRKPVSDT